MASRMNYLKWMSQVEPSTMAMSISKKKISAVHIEVVNVVVIIILGQRLQP
jgi:hypothetical protein